MGKIIAAFIAITIIMSFLVDDDTDETTISSTPIVECPEAMGMTCDEVCEGAPKIAK